MVLLPQLHIYLVLIFSSLFWLHTKYFNFLPCICILYLISNKEIFGWLSHYLLNQIFPSSTSIILSKELTFIWYIIFIFTVVIPGWFWIIVFLYYYNFTPSSIDMDEYNSYLLHGVPAEIVHLFQIQLQSFFHPSKFFSAIINFIFMIIYHICISVYITPEGSPDLFTWFCSNIILSGVMWSIHILMYNVTRWSFHGK